jgi:hypothetical protein
MSDQRYDLYYADRRLGVVTQVDSDFPNLWGTIVYDAAIAHPQSDAEKRMARFVELSIESMRLLMSDDAAYDDDEVSEVELNPVDAELERDFLDLVETNNWRLIDAEGQVEPILCPAFHPNDEIVWRWGVDA